MRVLIVHASAGGHEHAAHAIAKALAETGAVARVVDAVRLMPPSFQPIYRGGNWGQARGASWLWGVQHRLLDTRWIYAGAALARRVINGAIGEGLARLIEAERPDHVFATHFFATERVGRLKATGRTAARLIAVITDYLPHRVWIDPRVDLYAVASTDTHEGLRRRGVPEARIVVTGIPIAKKFEAQVDRGAVRRSLGFDEGVFTALVTSGAGGMSNVMPFVLDILALSPPVQVVLVCGSNRELLDSMSPVAERNPRLRTLGFVDNMHELMSAADVVIGKAGGVTITEALCKSLPLILVDSIPGQESDNARCLVRRGAALEARSARSVGPLVRRLAANPEELRRLACAAEDMAERGASTRIAKLVERFAGAHGPSAPGSREP